MADLKQHPAAWQRAASRLERHHPEFAIGYETAYRIADHHAARLPLGWESVPIMDGAEGEAQR